MSQNDAHYAGDLVDGAHIMKLFGDVATELTIRIDGDEGLLRAYDSVEFLSPVFAGDFLLIKKEDLEKLNCAVSGNSEFDDLKDIHDLDFEPKKAKGKYYVVRIMEKREY